MIGPGDFVVNHKPYLAAVGDSQMLTVSRSLVHSTDSDWYQPVAQYIRDHGLVLLSQKTTREDDMFGRTQVSWYVLPEVRNLMIGEL